MSSKLLIYLFIHGFLSTLFSFQNNIVLLLEQTVFNVLQSFQTDLVESSAQFSIVIQNYCFIDYHVFCHPSCTSVLSQISSLSIIYFILGVKSCSPIFLVANSASFRPTSHQSIFCIFYFSPFLNKFILLAMCLVCLVSLPLLSIHIADLLLQTI